MMEPRLLNREQAARYCSLSPGAFDYQVRTNRMPKPIRLGPNRVWDRIKLDAYIDALGGLKRPGNWDDALQKL